MVDILGEPIPPSAECQRENLGIIISLVGLIVPPLCWLHSQAWLVGFFVSAVSYVLLMPRSPAVAPEPSPAETSSSSAL